MRKINNNGFVLSETLIVTVFLMVIFSMIYSNFYPLIGEYEKRETYDDVDSVYSVYWLKKLIEDPSYIVNETRKNESYIRFSCNDVYLEDNKQTCANLVNAMNVSGCDKNGDNCDIFITNYNTSNFKRTVEENKENIFSSDFQDYVFNLPEYTKKSKNKANHRVIARFQHTDGNNNLYYSYSTIEISANIYTSFDVIYPIKYNLNGGINHKENPENYKMSNLPITLKDPTKKGYAFLGWSGSNGSIPDTNVEIQLGSTGTKYYEAHWKAIKPATPTFTDRGKAGTWTNQNFSMSLKTETEEDIIGNWYYRYPNNEDKTYHKYTNDNCKSNICTTTDFSAERHEPVEIIVCNKWAEDIDGKTELDIYNCSDPASETIKIDKTPPYVDTSGFGKCSALGIDPDPGYKFCYSPVANDDLSGVKYTYLTTYPGSFNNTLIRDLNAHQAYRYKLNSSYQSFNFTFNKICDEAGNCIICNNPGKKTSDGKTIDCQCASSEKCTSINTTYVANG